MNDFLNIDSLLRDRYHGAINIRGIRFQLLYSLSQALIMLGPAAEATGITLEGIEDADLKLHTGTEYIQVKTSSKPWKWHQLSEPVESFLKVMRADPAARLRLVFSFVPSGDMHTLANMQRLSEKERDRITNKFRDMCAKAGATLPEADQLLRQMHIETAEEKRLIELAVTALAESFDIGADAATIYMDALLARLLRWAEERQTVTAEDIRLVHHDFQESQSIEAEFRAYGKGLLERIAWECDPDTASFYDGKGAQPSHVSAGLDVARPRWAELIGAALGRARVCVIKSSSGQGKTTLAYRYVQDNWPRDNTFSLRVAETDEQVALISAYLRSRSKLLPGLHLLIDGADRRMRLWPEVAKSVVESGGQVLVTARNEDWRRFAKLSLFTFEVIEPELDLTEAVSIFRSFKREGRVHPSVRTAEHAYELVDKPHLLIEYVYYITHGEMLADRLKDQISQFEDLGEDVGKIDLLRRVSLANMYGARLDAGKLIGDVGLRGDTQRTLLALNDEYLTISDGEISELHWVRSEHLTTILHQGGFPSKTRTAIGCLHSIVGSDLDTFVASAIADPDVDHGDFISALATLAVQSGIPLVLTCLDGLFSGGERAFFDRNIEVFDKAYELCAATPFFMAVNLGPIISYDVIGEMRRTLGERLSYFDDLSELLPQIVQTDRGLHVCRDFLQQVCQLLGHEWLSKSVNDLGHLLDWCGLTNTAVLSWNDIRDRLLVGSHVFELSLPDFCMFAQGLHRYDEPMYHKWLKLHRDSIIGFLKLHTDSTQIELKRNVVKAEFIVDAEGLQNDNDQSVSRLEYFRSVFPHLKTYCAQGIWLLPFGLEHEYDQSTKHIPRENLHFKSDATKNGLWVDIVESRYRADSYYTYQDKLTSARRAAVKLVDGFAKNLRRGLQGQSHSFSRVADDSESVFSLLSQIPEPPSQMPASTRKELKSDVGSWATSLQNFLRQVADDDQKTKRLAIHNFLDATKRLRNLHSSFEHLLLYSPDYFEASELPIHEIGSYSKLCELLEVWLTPPPLPCDNIVRYACAQREEKKRRDNERIASALSPLMTQGVQFVFPQSQYIDHPLRYYPLAYSVGDTVQPELTLHEVVGYLVAVRDVADFFCLMPFHDGNRIGNWGYVVSSSQLERKHEGEEASWVAYAAQQLPEAAVALLPDMPIMTPPEYDLKIKLITVTAQIDLLRQLENALAPLSKSDLSFDRTLAEKWDDRLKNKRHEAADAAEAVRTVLQCNFASLSHSECYILVADYADIMQDALLSNQSVESLPALLPDLVDTMVRCLRDEWNALQQ